MRGRVVPTKGGGEKDRNESRLVTRYKSCFSGVGELRKRKKKRGGSSQKRGVRCCGGARKTLREKKFRCGNSGASFWVLLERKRGKKFRKSNRGVAGSTGKNAPIAADKMTLEMRKLWERGSGGDGGRRERRIVCVPDCSLSQSRQRLRIGQAKQGKSNR